MRGLRTVLASARDPQLMSLTGGEAPIAVLAQPHLDFETWCTAEQRGDELFYEGWTDHGALPFTSESHPGFDELARGAAHALGIDPALLELGMAQGKAWVLQVRSAPSRAPSRRPVPARPGPLHVGLGLRVHPEDEGREWRADLEHCPTPLSVLLATAFGRWIAADPTNSPSRILDGRWHDPVSPPPDPAGAESGWKQWQLQLEERIEPAVRVLQARHDALDGGIGSWRGFLDSWLDLQQDYFAMPTGAARAYARQALAGSRGRPGLHNTPGAERLRRWAMLREQLKRVLPAPSPESIARWIEENPRELLTIVLRKTAEFDRKIAPLPYDGFTPGLDEDPWPLYRALCSDITVPAPEPRTDELACAIVALAESDNDLLLESYALWRSAIRRVAVRRGLASARALHFLDIEAFESWLQAGGEVPDAASGRALHAAWSTSRVRGSGSLEGKPAAGGQARGPVRIARSLLEIEGTGIAVVETLGPADSIAVPRFDAIVCAAGDLLGHASVLCREFGIPCVVEIPGVRERLARATEVLVDGDRGLVRDLSEDGVSP
jgi:phosphohistidine swiveling domain-containing protein